MRLLTLQPFKNRRKRPGTDLDTRLIFTTPCKNPLTMLWQIEIRPADGQQDRDGDRVLAQSQAFGLTSISRVATARSFLLEGELTQAQVTRAATDLLVDSVTESYTTRLLGDANAIVDDDPATTIHVLLKPGVTDNVGASACKALQDLGLEVTAVATVHTCRINADARPADRQRLATRLLSNDAIERVIFGPLTLTQLSIGSEYQFELQTVPIRTMNDKALDELSIKGQLYLQPAEMQTIREHFRKLERDPTDIELETLAQTWSEHCSHKTLAGRIRYKDEHGTRQFENMLKETVFAATQKIRQQLGDNDWCVSVFKDNAGIVTFDEKQNVCIKVETHNHPSALEPYGGANTGLGGVIRDPLGTGLGARPVANTDVFCFAPPDTKSDSLPPGVLHPRVVMKGVVSGVRDYGNRMGIPTVNGAVYFDERYLGNPLVYCGNVAMIPVDKCEKRLQPGDLIVAIGGRTGRDGIHGATFSSAELTEESESLSGGAVQIGNAITEKMLHDVLLEARDRDLFSSVTDCGAGGFSSAVGEMGEETGAEVWLERCPLKYAGLSYTEIWISEAQERMVLAVPPANENAFRELCAAEGVEATTIGQFTDTGRLLLKYHGEQVGDLAMSFLHDGRPPVIREAVFKPMQSAPSPLPGKPRFDDDLRAILGSLNVCSKEWIIRQYDHEVQGGSVVKPLVGVHSDGPSDAAVIRPDLAANRGLVIGCGMNPRFGDFDPYWMAASAIDEAVRNCVAVGADPAKIAILDNFCWGNTERPETLGTLVRAALACHDVAIALQTPFVSGKDSLNNEFSFTNAAGEKQTVAIPSSLLITALGQMADITTAVTMDLKSPGNRLYLLGETDDELGGSHFHLVNKLTGGHVPRWEADRAVPLFNALHQAISQRLIRSCHDLSEGGLAVAAAEMAFAGGFGADLSIMLLPEQQKLADPNWLFSESNSRFLVEVPDKHADAFESVMANTACSIIGHVTKSPRLIIAGGDGDELINSNLQDLKAAWQSPLAWD